MLFSVLFYLCFFFFLFGVPHAMKGSLKKRSSSKKIKEVSRKTSKSLLPGKVPSPKPMQAYGSQRREESEGLLSVDSFKAQPFIEAQFKPAPKAALLRQMIISNEIFSAPKALRRDINL